MTASLAQHLLDEGFAPETVAEAQAAGPNLAAGLWAAKGLDEARIAAVLGRYFDLPTALSLEDRLDLERLPDLPLAYFKARRACPLAFDGTTLALALADPLDLATVQDLKVLFGAARADLVLAPPSAIAAAVNRLYARQSVDAGQTIQSLDEEAAGWTIEDLAADEDLLDSTAEAPAVKLVNSVLVEAVKRRASDIHVEPYRDVLKVRYRVDGLLYDFHAPPRGLAPAISSRIKVMANLDIAERRLPQDGRFRIKVADQEIDVRVSVVPTAFGERIVLRLLNKFQSLFTLAELGLSAAARDQLGRLIARTSGIILVTGPTGAGKTTTLYAALAAINTPEKNILTVEDPVEYQLPGLGQMQVNPKIGLTFARALRSILRHDPDVLLVGEIRDVETAQIAIHASQTGHLVFSTLHTNDAAGAVTRLLDMGIEPFLIASSVTGVLAQRLVRRVCPHCRTETTYPPELLRELGLTPADGPFHAGSGCGECFGAGYLGRQGLYELLLVSDPIRQLILDRATAGRIGQRAEELGMTTLLKDGAAKVKAGETTPEEVLRVVHS